MSTTNDSLIETFWQARQQGIYFPPAWFGKLTLDQAYAVQLGLIERRCAAGERQHRMESRPDRPRHPAAVRLPRAGVRLHPGQQALRPRVRPGRPDRSRVRERTLHAPAVSICRARSPWTKPGPRSTSFTRRWRSSRRADRSPSRSRSLWRTMRSRKRSFSARPPPLPADPAAIEARVSINGHPVATGTGDAVLGNPLNSIVWLAGKLGAYGRGLKAGEIVMTGSFTRQFPIAPGDTIETVFSGFGSVGTAMSEA